MAIGFFCVFLVACYKENDYLCGMKRTILLLSAALVSLVVAAQNTVAHPSYMTHNYLLSLLGIHDADEADDSLRHQLSAYVFNTPDPQINAKGGLMSVAAIQKKNVKEYDELLHHFLGIQPAVNQGQCVLHPSFPDSWDHCSIHTPELDYTFQRQGSELVYEVTQRFSRPVTIILRQNSGQGQYMEVKGNNQQRQTIRLKAPSRLPDVTFFSSCADSHITPPGIEEPSFEERFKPQQLQAMLTDSIPFEMDPEYLIDKEYVVRGVPFMVPQQGNNIVYVSSTDTLSVPLHTKASRAWLLLTGEVPQRDPHQSKAFVIAHYQDGTADILPLIAPDNWPVIQEGRAHRLCLRLNPDKKLLSLSIRPLAPDVKIGLMALTLQ